MQLCVKRYTAERIPDVLSFERRLRQEESFWGWEIDTEYESAVRRSFSDPGYANAVSFLAYEGGQVVGRVDASLLPSHFDGSVKAYLDWICVIRSCRHRGVARTMLKEPLAYLRGRCIETLVALTASNEEARRFYRSIPNSEMKDIGIWIDVGKGEENTN